MGSMLVWFIVHPQISSKGREARPKSYSITISIHKNSNLSLVNFPQQHNSMPPSNSFAAATDTAVVLLRVVILL